MVDIPAPVSSAVIIPDFEPSESPPAKRRRSSAAESTTKRPRLSEDARSQSPTTKPEIEPPSEQLQQRRKASVQEERKRGQRLFGGLLSTLSQTTPNNQHKRRQEIEKRQQERAKQQKAADEGRKAEKLANLKTVRQIEQIKVDEQSMKIRHTNMLAMANFLSTKAEPKLFYKPWELIPEEEERIKQQLIDTKLRIDNEVADFDTRHPKAVSEEEKTNGASTTKEPVGEPHTETSPPISNAPSTALDTTNSPVTIPTQAQSDQVTAQEEHNGEIVLENDEDTVIY